MLSDAGNCPHCFSPASHWLNPSRSWPAKQGKPIFRKVVEVAAKYKQYMGRDHEEKHGWLGSQTAYNLAQREAGGVHLVFNSLPGKLLPHVSSHQALPEDTVAHSQTQRPTSSAPSNTVARRRLRTVQVATVGRRDFKFTIPDASLCPTEGQLHL